MVDKFVNFRANTISSGTLGDPEASLRAAKLLRKTAHTGQEAMGGLPPKQDKQGSAIAEVANAEFDLRQKNESKSG